MGESVRENGLRNCDEHAASEELGKGKDGGPGWDVGFGKHGLDCDEALLEGRASAGAVDDLGWECQVNVRLE